MELHAFALLCGIATVTCCAHINSHSSEGWRWLLTMVLGLALLPPFALLLPNVVPLAMQASHAALLIALAAMSLLRRPSAHMALYYGGFLTALWISTLLTAAYPLLLAVLLPLAAALTTQLLALYRPGFRSESLLQEALIVLLMISLPVALVPELIAGWRSATALQGIDPATVAAPLVSGVGAVTVAVMCVLFGILYTRWKYK